MSRFETAASIGPLWQKEREFFRPVLNQMIADQLEISESSYDLLSHSIHVRNLAYAVGLRINRQFPNITDPDLIASSAMGHDYGKVKQQPNINLPYEHYVRTQLEIAMLGFPAIGATAGTHNFGALLTDRPITLEQMILIYADIRARTEENTGSTPIRKYKSLEEAMPEIASKLISSGQYQQADVLRGKIKLEEFEATLRKYNIDIDNLAELPDGFTPLNRQYFNPPLHHQDSRKTYSEERCRVFQEELVSQGIITLGQELHEKAGFYLSTIRTAVQGDAAAAEKLALIDPSLTSRWVKCLLWESRKRARWELLTNLATYLSVINDNTALHEVRVNYLKALGEFFPYLNTNTQSLVLSQIKSLFVGENIAEDDVAYHAAQVYGGILADHETYRTKETITELLDRFQEDPASSYTPVALRQVAVAHAEIADQIASRLRTIPIISIGLRGLDLYAAVFMSLDSVKSLDGLPPSEEARQEELVRWAYLFSRLLTSANRQLRIEATAKLVNLHQITPINSVKRYIEGLINSNKTHDMKYHQEVLAQLRQTTDPLVKRALCNVIQRFNYTSGEGTKDIISQTYNTLINIITSDPDNDTKLAALQALGRPGLARYLTIDQMDDVMQKLWNIFYFDPQTRKLLPYFMAGIVSLRSSYPRIYRDFDRLENVLTRKEYPDKQLQYEAARFFIGLVGTISDDKDERIRFAQKNILRTQISSSEFFDLVFQKYVTWITGTTYITDEQRAARVNHLVRKFISLPVGDSVARYWTYNYLEQRSPYPIKHREDIVIFTGTFDPIHKGAITVAETTSQLVGDVYLQVDSGNPLKAPKDRSIRNTIARLAISDQPNVFLFNDPEPFDYRKPEDYAELKRLFPNKTVWMLVGQDRLSAVGSYYMEEGQYVYDVPHILTIREANFPPSIIEMRNGQIIGDIQLDLLRYIQSNELLYRKIQQFRRIKIIGIPMNFSSTSIKAQIERGVLTNVHPSTIEIIAEHYADLEFLNHISVQERIDHPGVLDSKRANDELIALPIHLKEQLYTTFSQTTHLPPKENCEIFYDPITGDAYLCQMKGLRTERIIEVFPLRRSKII